MPSLRPQNVFAALATAILVSCALAAPVRGELDRAGNEQRGFGRSVTVGMNAFRRQHGLAPLHASSALRAAAHQHSSEMAAAGYFGHRSRNGESLAHRVARFYPMGRHSYWAVGETLVWSTDALTPEAALEMWLQSGEHRAIILQARWRELGVSAVHVPVAPGVYANQEVTIVTADFGVRRP